MAVLPYMHQYRKTYPHRFCLPTRSHLGMFLQIFLQSPAVPPTAKNFLHSGSNLPAHTNRSNTALASFSSSKSLHTFSSTDTTAYPKDARYSPR